MSNFTKPIALASAWSINSLAYSIVYPFIPIYLHEERQLPMETVGIIFPLMGLAVIITPPLAGHLTDRIGRGFMMQFGQTSRAAIFLILAVMAYLHTPFWLFALMLMVNAGIGTFFQIGSDAYLTDITTPAERPKFYSIIRIGTNIGWAIGPMLGAFLARTPFFLLFLLTALLCIFGAWFTGRCCRVQVSQHHGKPAERKLSIRQLLSDRMLLKLLGCSLLLYLLTSQLYSILSVYSTGVVGISKTALGLIYSLNGFAVIFFQLPLTWLLDRIGLPPLMRLVGGASFYALGYFSLGFAQNAWMLAGGVFVLTLGEVVVQPALFSLMSGLAPKGTVGRYMATLELTRGVGYSVGPYIGSVAFAHLSGSPIALWGLLSCFAVAAGLGYAKMIKK